MARKRLSLAQQTNLILRLLGRIKTVDLENPTEAWLRITKAEADGLDVVYETMLLMETYGADDYVRSRLARSGKKRK